MSELYKKIKPCLPYCFALAGGALMTYAFAPYEIGVASIFSCMILLWCLAHRSPKIGFVLGWIYGIGMFGLGTSWIYVSIHDYGNAAPWLAIAITSLFVVGLALFPAFMGFILNRFFPKNDTVRCLLAFPALWVAFEILRGWFLTGFPWLFVGYSQFPNHLRDFAPIGGVWLVSWAAVFVASVLYSIIDFYYSNNDNKKLRNGLFLAMFSIWAVAFALHRINWVVPSHQQPLNVALVQGNIAQLLRWDPKYIAQIVQTYQNLTQDTLQADLIIWPEAAIPVALPLSGSLFAQMDKITKANKTALIAGVPTELPDQMHFYNSLIAVGNAHGLYHKTHLVPFGEYVPLESLLRGMIGFFNLPMSSMVPGPDNQPLLVAQGYRFAPAICYEIAYPIYVQMMSKHADFILTVSNDAWFGQSIGPWQHLQIAQFRALENGKYVIRATNTGLTAIIAPNGEIQAIAPQFEPAVLTGTIQPMAGITPWNRFGVAPVIAALALTLGIAYWLTSRKKL